MEQGLGPTSVEFGRYELHCLLGEGGMARVYRASLSGPMGFRKEVAIKRIPRSVTEDTRVVRALVNEARLGGRLHHPHIVEVLELGEIREEYYLVMELVEGWTLQSLLSRGRRRGAYVPPSVAVEILQAVLRALRHAHELKDEHGTPLDLVHRDIKPGNVMISRAGDIKLMDFGVAKAATNLYKTTQAGVAKGTPAYMSPQQVRAEKLDGRSDLFSVGALLHELVTLRLPFPGNTVPAIVFAVLECDLEPGKARIRERAPALEAVFEALMQKEADHRPASAREAAAMLAAAANRLPPGPSLHEWLEGEAAHLPGRPLDGFWGDEAPPPPVLLDESRPVTVEVSFWGGAGPGDSSGSKDSGERPRTTAGTAIEQGLPKEAAPTRAEVAGARGGDTLDLQPGATPQTIVGGPPSLSRTETLPAAEELEDPEPPPRGPMLLAAAGGAMLAALLLVVALRRTEPPSPGAAPPTEPSTAAQREATPGPTAPPALATPTPTAPGGSSVAEVLPPENAPTAAEGPPPRANPARTPPRPAAQPDSAAKPAPVAIVEPVPAGSGWLSLNSNPWSSVEIDGEPAGTVPIKRLPASVGTHTVVFRCADPACPGGAVRSIDLEVRAGEEVKHVVKFAEGEAAKAQP